jgi:hypothetical protein
MRKILLLSAAASLLFVGSIFVGIAAATTGSPVLYDARAPQPQQQPTGSGGFDVEAGAAPDGQAGTPDDDVDEADASDDAPIPSPPPVSPGHPSPTPPPSSVAPGTGAPDHIMPSPEEQQTWLAFQQVVRECMAEAGHEYRHWEWWNTEDRDPQATESAMPPGLSDEASAAWELALHGTAADDAHDTGCWGVGLQSVSERRMMTPDAPPPTATPAPTPTP